MGADDVGRLRHVSSVQQVVIRVVELAVSELELCQEILEHLTVDLPLQHRIMRHFTRSQHFLRFDDQGGRCCGRSIYGTLVTRQWTPHK